MNGKRVLVTGATSGIGLVSAKELARLGAQVIVVGRDPSKTERVINEIQAESGNEQVEALIADLSSMAEVRQLAAQFLAKYDSLDVLLNNAGALINQRTLSADGYEMTFALNHLNYFLLTNLLLPTLKQTAAQKGEARIVNVASGVHTQRKEGMPFDDLQYEKSYPMAGFHAYATSKLANILFTHALAEQLKGSQVTVNALHPGFVASNFGPKGKVVTFIFRTLQRFAAKSPEEGAQTSIYLASSDAVKGVSGSYWVDQKAVRSSEISYDRQQQQRLWAISAELTGI